MGPIGAAKWNAKYRLTRGHVCERSHGCAHDVLVIVRGYREFKRWAERVTALKSINRNKWKCLNLSIYRSAQWSSMHLCATSDWKEAILIPHRIFSLWNETGSEWTVLWKYGKMSRNEQRTVCLLSLQRRQRPSVDIIQYIFTLETFKPDKQSSQQWSREYRAGGERLNR